MSKKHTGGVGDAPIESHLHNLMNDLARFLDRALNGEPDTPTSPPRQKRNGFILMVFPFEGHEGRCNYISNANRADVLTMLKEQVKRFEGQPEMTGKA